MSNLLLKTDHAAVCNAKWAEANALYGNAWECYMDLGKELRELKEGELKGRFKQWCNSELEFSYTWAKQLMSAYNKYELSGFTDEPQKSIKAYANSKGGNPSCPDEIGTLADLLKPEPMTKREQTVHDWITKNPGQYDEMDKEFLSKILPVLKGLVKKYGNQVIFQAREILPMINPKDL